MTPPIENSITRTSETRWLLGSLYVCDLVESVPNDAVTSWQDDGKTYCIRKAAQGSKDLNYDVGDSESQRIHHAGTSAAVWKIGGMIFKVKGWREGMELESDTIRYVNLMAPSITTPEVVFTWVDVDWNRSFLVLNTMKGRTLDEAWQSLSADQRTHAADAIAQHCKTLASLTSDKLVTASGAGVLEEFLTANPADSEPSWRRQFLGPFSSSQLRTYLSGNPIFDGHIDRFYYHHADLGPGNIFVSEDGIVSGIIDWESAAFFPRFWIGTKPVVSAGFFIQAEEIKGAERRAWVGILADALERKGFPSNMEVYKAWKRAIEK